MTNAQSKFFQSVSVTCKDYNHPWTDHCANATAGLLFASTPYCLRVYTVVYLLSMIMRHRIPSKDDIKHTIKGIIQSTAFLVTNAYTFILYNCIIRHIFGCYYQATVSFIPSFFSSLTAIMVERPARRPMLTLYVANVATETLWNMACARGWVRSIPHGQTFIFGISVSILLYLYRLGLHKTTSKDSLFDILRIFVGRDEEGPVKNTNAETTGTQSTQQNADVDSATTSTKTRKSRPAINVHSAAGLVALYGRFIDTLKGKHASCVHKRGCIHYAVIGGLKPLLGGIGLQVLLKTVLNIQRIIQGRMDYRKTIFNRNILNLGIFLGSFSFIYKAISCSLRHTFGRDHPLFAIPAGLIGSVTFTQYPDITVALYLMWKMLQIVYDLGITHGKLPRVPGFIYFFYSFCTATLFHAGVLEPNCLRPSYLKFLQDISGERLSKFNLEPFDVFGFEPSQNSRELLKSLNIVNHSALPKFAFAD